MRATKVKVQHMEDRLYIHRNYCLQDLKGKTAIPLNVEHKLTRQRRWDKQETQEYMRHFNALKLDKLTSDPR